MRPFCITSKSERSALTYSPKYRTMLETYAQDQADMYDWEIPDEINDVPTDWIERSLFYKGNIGICPYNSSTKSKFRLTPGSGTKYDVYGQMLKWIPTVIDPNSTIHVGVEWWAHRYPILQLSYAPIDFVYEYVRLRHSSLISAGQNTVAMRQPVAIAGQEGEIGMRYIADMVEGGNSYLPTLDGDGSITRDVEVLDLGAQNFLDPLTGFIDATDSWASRMLGTDSASTQKESGISIQEVTAGDKRVKARRMNGLKQRRNWCERVEEATGITLEVYINDEYSDPIHGVSIADGLDPDIRDDQIPASGAGKT